MAEVKVIYQGMAQNGPYNGMELESRFPKGILFINKSENTCILYDYMNPSPLRGMPYFKARTDTPVPLKDDPHGDNRYRAAAEFEYEVRAAIEGAPW